MDLKHIFKNNQSWVAAKLASDEHYFENLSKGQAPELLYIGCADSRVTAETVMGLEPGDVFVHRNIANMVVNTDLSVLSVINYAVEHLHVKHIVVCGHYECGGIKAAMQHTDLGMLNPWVRNIRDVYRLHMEELDAIADEQDRHKRFVEINVVDQCVNIMKTAVVQKAHRDNAVKIHGWVFDMYSGKLIDLGIDFDGKLEGTMGIYRLH
jgi:carbonic anhydrase